MLKFFLKIIPNNYKWNVAAKYIGLGAGKLAMSLLAGSIGKDMATEHVEAIGVAVTLVTNAGLDWVHDWASVKWPGAKL